MASSLNEATVSSAIVAGVPDRPLVILFKQDGADRESAMARDYYPLIARAVAGLEQNIPEARQRVYERARRVLREQVRDFKPSLSASERMDELLALEQAIASETIVQLHGQGPFAITYVNPADDPSKK